CDLLALNRRDFLPMLRETPDLALKLMELLCRRLRQTNEHVEDLAFLDLPSRLAKVLLRLAGPEKRTPVRITQKELGDIIGMSRESTNKQLRAWEDKGWVQLEKGGVLIKNAGALARQTSD
ncbi:MAG: Crp/Fnr family transcriptional regulator, partial [Pseudomonadota bacterium]|nr:Crp/Fnr family transcriptional regulator [Pseudomonadota bacterium]